ncbi:MAG: HAD family hydrolase, partial [Planctomycetota bacterium]
MDALIFDFDGVVVDSEPVHLMGFRKALQELGADLTREDYYGKYLGFDDHDCFAAVLREQKLNGDEALIARLTAVKTKIVQEAFAESIDPQAGAVELIRCAAHANIPLGICSGALREEIELAARCVGVLECLGTTVAAEAAAPRTPEPDSYQKPLTQ